MKINIEWSKPKPAKAEKQVWHKWFAWYPVVIGNDLVIFQYVMRRIQWYEFAEFNLAKYKHVDTYHEM